MLTLFLCSCVAVPLPGHSLLKFHTAVSTVTKASKATEPLVSQALCARLMQMGYKVLGQATCSKLAISAESISDTSIVYCST